MFNIQVSSTFIHYFLLAQKVTQKWHPANRATPTLGVCWLDESMNKVVAHFALHYYATDGCSNVIVTFVPFVQTYLTRSITGCPTGTVYKSVQESADGAKSEECFDIVGRSVRQRSYSLNNITSKKWVNSDVVYDNLGRAIERTEPYFDGDPKHWSVITYDILGRPTKVTLADESISTTEYNGLTTVTTNDKGHKKTETRNVLGEIVSVKDHLNGVSKYTYDAQGNLVEMFGPSGSAHTTIIRYDNLGRKQSMTDPDKGNWSYEYNTFGELISQCDGKYQTTKMSYDRLGRMTSRRDYNAASDCATLGTLEGTTTWSYDSLANGVGQLAEVVQGSYRQVPSYDALGRVIGATTTINNTAYNTRQTYNAIGQVFQSFDAASGQRDNGHRGVQYEYELGIQTKVRDVRNSGDNAIVYEQVLKVDARGNVTSSEQGNNVKTTRTYDEHTGRIKTIKADTFASVNIQNLAYEWDSIGNLNHRKETSGSKSLQENFLYDGLNRLTRSTTQSNGQSHVQSLTYYGNGNIKTKSDVEGGATYQYGSLEYGCRYATLYSPIAISSAVKPGPHAVNKINNKAYCYDANGNNISGSGRYLQYTTFDKVKRIKKGDYDTTFTYGPSRSRYKRTDTDGTDAKTTWYLGNVEIIETTSGENANTIEYRRSLGSAIESIIYKNNSINSIKTSYLHFDHLGSVDVITDTIGSLLQELSFDAWGKRRNATNWATYSEQQQADYFRSTLTSDGRNSEITTRGFTGHEMVDGVGIIHMNGRIYDAHLGRFLQADPIVQEPFDTQVLNRYSYVRNNPLNATDPSGHVFFTLFASIVLASLPSVTAIQVGLVIFATATLDALAQGASLGDALRSGFISGLAAFTFASIGTQFAEIGSKNVQGIAPKTLASGVSKTAGGSTLFEFGKGTFLTAGQITGQIALHATAGGVFNVLQGGTFGHGFISAGLVKGLTPAIGSVGGLEVGGVSFAQAAVAAVVGGTVSKISGGKFANGAYTAAFQNLFNQQSQTQQVKAQEEYARQLREHYQNKLEEYQSYIDGLSPESFNKVFGTNGIERLGRNVVNTQLDKIRGSLNTSEAFELLLDAPIDALELVSSVPPVGRGFKAVLSAYLNFSDLPAPIFDFSDYSIACQSSLKCGYQIGTRFVPYYEGNNIMNR